MSARREFLRAGLALGGAALAPCAATGADAPAALTSAPTSQAGVAPRLTFHAVDVYHGATGAGLELELSRFDGERWQRLKTVHTNAGGRTDEPLLAGDAYRAGRYEVLMHVDAYFARLGVRLPRPSFLSAVPLRFVIHDPGQRVHLPVLFSPWGYSYYRGS
jgi:5-hydroxyisourate hydrolase